MAMFLRHDKMASTNQTNRTTQKHVEHQDATDIQKNYFSCFSAFKRLFKVKVDSVLNLKLYL